MGTLIIAEAGVNHNCDIEIAKKLCLAAKKSGADVVKFQTWKTENLLTRNVAQADYQLENTGNSESQFDMLKKLELPYSAFAEIKQYCDEIGIQFASTADDEESLEFLVSLGIPFIKVGSGEIGNISYLRKMGSKGLPVILSTGMSSLADVENSIVALREGGVREISLLHCTTNYPCPYDAVNLRAMDTLKSAFNVPVGYSDHTIGIEIAIAAVAKGAQIIEKHFTLDKKMNGPDHLASTEPEEFSRMVKAIRNVEKCLGTGEKTPTASEKEISKVVVKRVVAKRNIRAGEIIHESDIAVKRNNRGVSAKYWDLLIGTSARKDYSIDEPIEL